MICVFWLLFGLYVIINTIAFGAGLIAGIECEKIDPKPRRIEFAFPGFRMGYWAAQRNR